MVGYRRHKNLIEILSPAAYPKTNISKPPPNAGCNKCTNKCYVCRDFLIESSIITIVSQPGKCLKFMTFREGCFVIHVEYRYLSETLETFYYHQFYRKRNKIVSVN